MRIRTALPLLLLIAVVPLALAQAPASAGQPWQAVEQAMGRPGQMQPGDVLKFALPRRDMHVSIDRVEVRAGFGLGSWVAFKGAPQSAMVMGDLVLADSEVEPVLTSLEEGGVEITALHNHLLRESPRVMYMHIGGHGDAVKLAQAIRAALKLTSTPDAAPASPAAGPGLDQARIESALGRSGKMNGGVLQFTIPRAETVTMHAQVVPPAMGVATAINLEPAGGGTAAATGDFVLLAGEVNPVIATLRKSNMDVTAIHSHMLDEEPRLFFLHFWGHGDPAALASGLRAAIARTNSAPAK
jgi:Domain of Unknown Function (DUF1259)